MAAKIAIEIRPCGRRAASSAPGVNPRRREQRVPRGRLFAALAGCVRQDRFHQLADGVKPLHLLFGNVGAEALLERGQQLDALHRVEAEIELEIGVGHDRRAWTRRLFGWPPAPRPRQGARARHGPRPRVPVHLAPRHWPPCPSPAAPPRTAGPSRLSCEVAARARSRIRARACGAAGRPMRLPSRSAADRRRSRSCAPAAVPRWGPRRHTAVPPPARRAGPGPARRFP